VPNIFIFIHLAGVLKPQCFRNWSWFLLHITG